MPNIPTYTRRITVKPAGKAPLPVVDTAGGAVGAGLGQLGKGISDVGDVLFQIKREQLDLNDAINAVKANTFINSEKKNFATLIETTEPNVREDGLSDWETSSAKSFAEMRKNISTLQFTGRRRKMMDAQLDALEEMRAVEIRQAQSDYLVKQSRAYLQQNLHDALVSNNPLMIEAAMGLFEMNKKHAWGNDTATADAIYRDTIKEGRKEFYIDQSKLFPDAVIEEMMAKKKALGKGGKDKDGLGAKDFDDVIASAYMAKNLQDNALDEKQEADRDVISKAIRENNPDVFELIEKSSLDETEQWTWSERASSSASAKASGKDIITDEEVKGSLEKMAYDIWTGAVSFDDFKKHLNIARYDDKTIDDTAYDEIMSLGQRELKSYQATAMREREDYALKQLVDLPTEYDLNERLRHLTSQFQIDQTISLRKLQLENHDKYKKALRDLIKDNPDWDADEIYIQSQKLLTQYRFTPEQLRKIKETPVLDFMTGLSAGEGLTINIGPETEPKAKPPSSPPPKDKAYTGFTVMQNGTNYKWVWDGKQWLRAD